MSIDAVWPAAIGALLGGTLSFLGAYIQRQQVERRASRSTIYTTHLRDALAEVEEYVKRPYRDGPLEYMSTEALSSLLKELYRRALTTSRGDEVRTRSLWHAAQDMDDARRRAESQEQIARIREGGWLRLSYDTVIQAEMILLSYERWLQRRLLARPRRGHPHDYVRIEIDRDILAPDTSAFDAPTALSTDVLRTLLDMPLLSWRVRSSVPIYGRLLDLWVCPEDAGRAMQRIFETNDRWLVPLGAFEDEERRGCLVVTAAIEAKACQVPAERNSKMDTLHPEGRRSLPDVVRCELEAVFPTSVDG